MQIASIRELRPVSVVRLHMVHIRGPGADTTLCTFPTKRFPQKLLGSQIIHPLRREIHPVPGLGLLAAPGAVFGLVGCTVSTRHQDAAARMPARSERLQGHGLSPPGKTKSPPRQQPPQRKLSARAIQVALAIFDIDEMHGLTPVAPQLHVLCHHFRGDMLICAMPAYRANDVSVFHCQFIASWRFLQCDFLTFFKTCILFH